ncbi:MAG: O-antigen ligase family protein, partial [Patescibacteria group bacterium]
MKKVLEYLLYLFIFLLSWQTRWIVSDPLINGNVWEYGRISIYSFDIIFVLILSIFLILNFKSFKIKNVKYILLGVLFVVLNFVVADNKLINFYWLLRIFQSISLIWMFSRVNFNKVRFIWIFVASMGLSAGLGIYQFLSQSAFASKWLGLAVHSASVLGQSVIETGGERWLRAYGTFPHPNILAGFLVISLVLSFYLYPKLKKVYQKNILIILSLISSAALFFIFSRAAWIAGILIIFYHIFLLKNKKILPIVCLIIFVLLSVIYLPLVKTRITGTERLEVKSNTERISGYTQAFEIIKKHPLLGVGAGNHTVELQKMYPDQSAWDYVPVHNIYLLIFSEVGIIGMILILLLFYYYFKDKKLKYLFFYIL